ncbi:DUF6655 family protein [Calycomorphotria hydatis]|uniref:Uncharacterized protein n=1 Tax=Calycomorphotria hydatis TaxID=2528027 RepID=A0A517TBC1_9PLAN|nr:DUF6655 family protein [Calycomorphotria hydatis]QDT65673.1 hypothetical protein V22_29320 [Calycomorphotria hydatis]
MFRLIRHSQILNALLGFAVILSCGVGCATVKTSNTARTGMEQLLISNAVDQSLNQVDFRPFGHQKVFLDTQYLDCIDKGYVISATRHRLLHAGATIVEKSEDSDFVVEVRSGGVGTDSSEAYVGIPEISVPLPLPLTIPEVRIWSRNQQHGTAKLGIVAYDKKMGSAVGVGGTTLARADDSNSYFAGIGPFQSGDVRSEVKRSSSVSAPVEPIPQYVAFHEVPASRGNSGPANSYELSPSSVKLVSAEDIAAKEQPQDEAAVVNAAATEEETSFRPTNPFAGVPQTPEVSWPESN